MSAYRLLKSAELRIADIYAYSYRQWSEEQAEDYVGGLLACCNEIGKGKAISRAIPPSFGVTGRYTRYRQHLVYWRMIPDGSIEIVTVLHQSMDQTRHLGDEFA